MSIAQEPSQGNHMVANESMFFPFKTTFQTVPMFATGTVYVCIDQWITSSECISNQSTSVNFDECLRRQVKTPSHLHTLRQPVLIHIH